LELLARRTFTEEPTLISRKFSEGFYKLLVDKNCIEVESGDVILDKLEKKFKKDIIDVEYLNQTLKPDCEFLLEEEEEDQT